MSGTEKKVVFALFFLSGFCGLLYQMVWVRMAFASFGVITPVLSIVISVFMLGLFAGSWTAGKAVRPITSRTGLSAIWLYAAAELLIGAGAFAVPRLLARGEAWLLRAGESDSSGYLFWSALILAGAILPWCVFMGATVPWMMAFVKERDGNEHASFSFLYLANVIGAMTGTLVTALLAVELLGFKRTLLVGASMNACIAAAAAALGARHPRIALATDAAPAPTPAAVHPHARLAATTLFITGFTSMAMEVAWTRAFTAVLATEVYSFAALLFGYLLATWLGSLVYRRHLSAGRVVATARLLAGLAITATFPILLNDPRLHLNIAGVFLGILPFCGLLGYLTPKLIDRYSGGRPEAAGFSYAVNVLGCVIGPICASYVLLPLLGVKLTLLLLAAPYAVLLAGRASRKQLYPAVGLFLVALFVSKTYEDQVQDFRGEVPVRRDHTATVIAYGHGMQKRLLVNGVGMTHLTTITKLMAHLPLAVVGHPRSALDICFGMGTTYRSLLSWGDVRTTAVELIPSVKDSFGYFFDDAKDVLGRPEGTIVVDDGRRFLRRTRDTFDVITLDPPPPVEAAASSLLYSEEFYAAAKSRLSPGGIVQQWVPKTETRIVQAVARSLLASFPYVRMYRSFEGAGLEESGFFGYHFLASMQPIVVPPAEELAARIPERAKADLVEWLADKDAVQFLRVILEQERDAHELARGGNARITDDRPFNEYYLLRRIFSPLRSGEVWHTSAAW